MIEKIKQNINEIKEGGFPVLIKKFKESMIFRTLSGFVFLGIFGVILYIFIVLFADEEMIKPVYYTLEDIEVICNNKYSDPENKQVPRKVILKIRFGIMYKNDSEIQDYLDRAQIYILDDISDLLQEIDPKDFVYFERREAPDGVLNKITKSVKEKVPLHFRDYIYEVFIIQQIMQREG